MRSTAGLSSGAVIGIAAGGAIGLAVAGYLAYSCANKKKETEPETAAEAYRQI